MANAPFVPDDDPIARAEDLIASGNAAVAARDLEARLAAGRGGLLMRLALAKAWLAAGEAARGLDVARDAARFNPDIAVCAEALGEALLAAEHLPTAIAEFQRALRLDSGSLAARLGLARAWLAAGEGGQARDALSDLDGPDADALRDRARAILDAPRSDPGYVRHLFDQFSADYDTRMRGPLGYAAPEILRDLAALVMPGRDRLAILDLGCGTGLGGAAFADLAARLDGIDLSPAMLARARERGIYTALAVADLETALAVPGPAYDLILAADTLVYLGDLTAVMHGARARLAPHGFFLFTVERDEGETFALGPKRRWRHSEAYLRAVAASAGLSVAGLVAAAPRLEANQPVDGFAVALTPAA